MTDSILTEADKDRIHEVAEPKVGKKPMSALQIAFRIGKPEGAVQWYMYQHGLKRLRRQKVAAPYRLKDGTLVRRFTPDEDTFIMKLRADDRPLSEIAARFAEAFGYDRKSRSIYVRLIMLAGFEAAAEDMAAVNRALAA